MGAHCNPPASADCGGDENGVAAPSRWRSSSKRVGVRAWRRSVNGSIQSLARQHSAKLISRSGAPHQFEQRHLVFLRLRS